jgi:hypothetical protein
MALGKLQNPNVVYLPPSCQEFRKKGVKQADSYQGMPSGMPQAH